MASIKNFKKEISYVLGELIDAVTIWEITTGAERSKSEEVVENIISVYNGYIQKINDRQATRNSAYFQSLRKDLEKDLEILVEKINSLN